MKDEEPTALTFPLEDPTRIVCPVLVGSLVPDADSEHVGFGLHGAPFKALWDTGAMRTMVVPMVIRAAKLKAVSFERTAGIDGSITIRKTYHAVIVTQSDLTVQPGRKARQARRMKLHGTTVIGLERDGQLQAQCWPERLLTPTPLFCRRLICGFRSHLQREDLPHTPLARRVGLAVPTDDQNWRNSPRPGVRRGVKVAVIE